LIEGHWAHPVSQLDPPLPHSGAAERTIKFHRAHIMEKMEAGSVAELVRMAGHPGIAPQG
jgi:hypothetical protein